MRAASAFHSQYCGSLEFRGTARSLHLNRGEAEMRAWFVMGVGFFVMAVLWTLVRSREDEEMFIRLGDRELRSLPV
jgi:hypothetical protein